MTIALGADHAGFEIKQEILKSLQLRNISCMDYGTYTSERVDYPDFAHPVALAVEQGVADFGVLVCGSGNGVAITANKHQGIRAAVCWNEELAQLARQHNNANIIAVPGRYVDKSTAIRMIELFLATEFEGGRHTARVDKIPYC